MASNGSAKSAWGSVVGCSSKSLAWLTALLSDAQAELTPPTASLASALLLPATVASVLDHQPGKPAAHGVGLFEL